MRNFKLLSLFLAKIEKFEATQKVLDTPEMRKTDADLLDGWAADLRSYWSIVSEYALADEVSVIESLNKEMTLILDRDKPEDGEIC